MSICLLLQIYKKFIACENVGAVQQSSVNMFITNFELHLQSMGVTMLLLVAQLYPILPPSYNPKQDSSNPSTFNLSA